MSRLLNVGSEQLTTVLLRMNEAAEKVVRTSITGFMDCRNVREQVGELSKIILKRQPCFT